MVYVEISTLTYKLFIKQYILPKAFSSLEDQCYPNVSDVLGTFSLLFPGESFFVPVFLCVHFSLLTMTETEIGQ